MHRWPVNTGAERIRRLIAEGDKCPCPKCSPENTFCLQENCPCPNCDPDPQYHDTFCCCPPCTEERESYAREVAEEEAERADDFKDLYGESGD